MFIRSRIVPFTALTIALTVISSLTLASCKPSSPLTQDVELSEPTGVSVPDVDTSKSTTIVIAEEPPSFNPIVADTGFDALVMELVLLGMTDVDPKGNVFPELAVELPTPENGGVTIDKDAGTMSVTWKMRDDVQWQDGIHVTANDVLFTWNAISNPTNGSWMPGSDYIESVEKVDDYSFKVHYNTIYPGYLTQFGGEQLAIWPEHYCDADQGFVAWDCGLKPLSDGPFVLTEWVKGDHMTFAKNDKYYQAGKPDIEKVTVRIVPDYTVRKSMVMNGDADIDMWIDVNSINEVKDNGTVKVSLSPVDRWVIRLFMNQAAKGTTDPVATPHPILADVRVRRAIRMAVDVDKINSEIFHGLAHPVWTEFFRPPYVCDVTRPTFDPQAARALLEEAGWTDTDSDGIRECHGCANAENGYKMEMEFITYAEYGEPLELTQQLIAEMLGNIGINMNVSVVEGSVLWDRAENGGIEQSGNFDIDLWDKGYAGVDPTDYLWDAYSEKAMTPGNGWNFFRWNNPVVNALINDAYTLDEQTRHENFCAIADFINEEVPEIHLFTVPNAEAYSARIEGVQSSVNDLVTWNIADWKIK